MSRLTTILPLLLAAGCYSGVVETKPDDTGASTDDTGVVTDDTGDTGETQDTGEVEPEEEPDYSVWIGERYLDNGDCDGVLTEDGLKLTRDNFDGDIMDWLEDNCPSCDHFYELYVSPSEICGVGVTTTTYRAVELDADRGDAVVYQVSNNGFEELDDRADFDGWTIEYNYEVAGFDIDGTVEFPEL